MTYSIILLNFAHNNILAHLLSHVKVYLQHEYVVVMVKFYCFKIIRYLAVQNAYQYSYKLHCNGQSAYL